MCMQVGARSGKRTYTGHMDNNISYSVTEICEFSINRSLVTRNKSIYFYTIEKDSLINNN